MNSVENIVSSRRRSKFRLLIFCSFHRNRKNQSAIGLYFHLMPSIFHRYFPLMSNLTALFVILQKLICSLRLLVDNVFFIVTFL